MATSVLTDSLKNFVFEGDPVFGSPFTVSKWAVASNRKWIVAVKGPSPYPSMAEEEPTIKRYLSSEPTQAQTVTVEALRSWAGGLPDEPDTMLFGRVMGVKIDVLLLMRILDGFAFKTVSIWDATSVAAKACLGLFTNGGRWVAFLGGVISDEEDLDPFNPESQKSVFDLAMDL